MFYFVTNYNLIMPSVYYVVCIQILLVVLPYWIIMYRIPTAGLINIRKIFDFSSWPNVLLRKMKASSITCFTTILDLKWHHASHSFKFILIILLNILFLFCNLFTNNISNVSKRDITFLSLKIIDSKKSDIDPKLSMPIKSSFLSKLFVQVLSHLR